MNMKTFDEIDFNLLRVSAILIDPKPLFIDKMKSLISAPKFEKLYFQEENAVWISPGIGNFGDEVAFWKHVEKLKPKFLKVELNRFIQDHSMFGEELDSETFDRYFDLRLRDIINDTKSLQ